MTSLLIPLWVVLSIFGLGNLGMTDAQTHDAYVVYTSPHLGVGDESAVYNGFACGSKSWGVPEPEPFTLACSALPDRTIVIQLIYWPLERDFHAYLIRHEMEHLFLGPTGPADDLWQEEASTEAGCTVVFNPRSVVACSSD